MSRRTWAYFGYWFNFRCELPPWISAKSIWTMRPWDYWTIRTNVSTHIDWKLLSICVSNRSITLFHSSFEIINYVTPLNKRCELGNCELTIIVGFKCAGLLLVRVNNLAIITLHSNGLKFWRSRKLDYAENIYTFYYINMTSCLLLCQWFISALNTGWIGIAYNEQSWISVANNQE